MTNSKKKFLNQQYLIYLFTALALTPQYIIRCNFDILYWMYYHFTTYFSDIWYCWDVYLHHNFPYPREYPAGIQLLFKFLYKIPYLKDDFIYYMSIMAVIFLAISLIISNILLKLKISTKNILLFWLLTPSFLFYGFWNLDILPILTMIAAYYYFKQDKFYATMILLALGTTLKVFPIFVLPIYILAINDHKLKAKMSVAFVFSWLVMNIPMMILDWGAWIFPYEWQIQSNFSRSMQDGSWTWVLYVLLDPLGYGSLVGKISLVLFATGYLALITKYKNTSFEAKFVIVMLFFLLTDRIYSPQYDLYLLSALVLFRGRINLFWFYMLEIPNFIQGFFLFYLKNHAYLLQIILVFKYLAIIMLLIGLLRQQRDNNTSLSNV